MKGEGTAATVNTFSTVEGEREVWGGKRGSSPCRVGPGRQRWGFQKKGFSSPVTDLTFRSRFDARARIFELRHLFRGLGLSS